LTQPYESNGVSIQNNGDGKKSRITLTNAGTYNIQFSAQVQNFDNQPQDIFIWLKKNGTDVGGSTGAIGVPARKNVDEPYHTIVGWNFVFTAAANDYYEFYWSTQHILVSIQYYSIADNGSPTKPSTASLVLTVTQVMYTQLGPQGTTGTQGLTGIQGATGAQSALFGGGGPIPNPASPTYSAVRRIVSWNTSNWSKGRSPRNKHNYAKFV